MTAKEGLSTPAGPRRDLRIWKTEGLLRLSIASGDEYRPAIKITWVHKIKTKETSYQAKDLGMYSAKRPSTMVEAASQRTNRAPKLQTQFVSEDKIHVGKGQIYSVS
jgi:hypothetical protein